MVEEGLGTGIAVSPVAYRSPVAFAMSAGTLSAISGGRFILGIGSGGIYRPAVRRALGFGGRSTIASMREYVTAVRALLAGETVDVRGEAVHLEGVQLGIDPPPRTPVFLGALGPRMLALAGEVADGAALNWCSSERVAWSRERVAEGAAGVGRDPGEVRLAEYIRICVDDDVEVARSAYVRSLMGYASAWRCQPKLSGVTAIVRISSGWATRPSWASSTKCVSVVRPPMNSWPPSLTSSRSKSATSAGQRGRHRL